MIKKNSNGVRGTFLHYTTAFGAVILLAGMLLWNIGCSSGPAAPTKEKLTKFLTKHVSMIDESITDFYVDTEKASILSAVRNSIRAKKERGVYEDIKNATYDFSGVKFKVMGKKEDYVNDMPAKLIEVNAKGKYTVTHGSKSEVFKENEFIVLQAVGNQWKVTEKINPWI